MEAQKQTDPAGAALLQDWVQNHIELERLADELLNELVSPESVPSASAHAALERFADALDRHFSAEERIYFPMVEIRQARHAPALERARSAHEAIRRDLDEAKRRLAEGDLPGARHASQLLLERFHAHEREEDRLIEDLRVIARTGL